MLQVIRHYYGHLSGVYALRPQLKRQTVILKI